MPSSIYNDRATAASTAAATAASAAADAKATKNASVLKDINWMGGTSYMGGPSSQDFSYGGKKYTAIRKAGESADEAALRVLNAGQSESFNKDPVTGLVGPQNQPIQDWQKQIGGSPDAGPLGHIPGAYGSLGDIAKGLTLTKDQLQAELDHGANHENAYTPETSKGSQIQASLAGPNSPPPSGGTGTGTGGTGTGTGGVGGGTPADPTAPLPYPNVGAPPTPPGGMDEFALNQQYGIDATQQQVGMIDQQIADIYATQQKELSDIMNTPGVSTRYMSREAHMAKSGQSQQLASLRAQRSVLTRQLTQSTHAIGMIMRAKSVDFANAEKQYQFEVSQNDKAQALFDKQATAQQTRDRAELTFWINKITAGEVTMTPDEKNTLDRLGMEVYGADWANISQMIHPKDVVSHDVVTNSETGARMFEQITQDPVTKKISVVDTPLLGKGVRTPGSKLTLSEARTSGLPLSLVGMSQEQVAADLQSSSPPHWFTAHLESQSKTSMTPASIASLWSQFQSSVMNTEGGLNAPVKPKPSVTDTFNSDIESFKQYKGLGYSRSEAENMWKQAHGQSATVNVDIPGPISKQLDQLYP